MFAFIKGKHWMFAFFKNIRCLPLLKASIGCLLSLLKANIFVEANIFVKAKHLKVNDLALWF